MYLFFSKLTYMLCFNRKQMKNIVSEWEAKLRQIIQYLLGNNIFCVKTTADICRTMRKEKLDLDSNTYLVTFIKFCYLSKEFKNRFAILIWLAFLGPSYVFGVGCNNSLAVSKDIHIECSKQFKWNFYFYVFKQSQPFWAVLKPLLNLNMKFE